MPVREPRYSREEFAQRGADIYERDIRGQVEKLHMGKFVAIDVESGAYAIDEDDYTATERLFVHHPDAQIWLMRVGYSSAYRIGSRAASTKV